MGGQAFEDGYTPAQINEYTKIDPWFLSQLDELHRTEEWLKTQNLGDIGQENMFQLKRRGFSDPQIARATGLPRSGPFIPCWKKDFRADAQPDPGYRR